MQLLFSAGEAETIQHDPGYRPGDPQPGKHPLPAGLPGTVIPQAPGAAGAGMFAQLRPMLEATDGLSLGQVCAITGLEPSTVQNWIKRGFVSHPINKKYRARQLARILLIAALRDCMPLERIGELMTCVNGDTDDEGDDIISEDQLYDYLCAIVAPQGADPEPAQERIRRITAAYRAPDEGARGRLMQALLVMTYAYEAKRYKQAADACFASLKSAATE